jgi:hypothetical protein
MKSIIFIARNKILPVLKVRHEGVQKTSDLYLFPWLTGGCNVSIDACKIIIKICVY